MQKILYNGNENQDTTNKWIKKKFKNYGQIIIEIFFNSLKSEEKMYNLLFLSFVNLYRKSMFKKNNSTAHTSENVS